MASPEEQLPQKTERKKNFFLLKVIAAFLLALLLLVAAAIVTLRQDPKAVFTRGLAFTKVPAKFGEVSWLKDGSLQLNDVSVGDYFRAKTVYLKWKWQNLLFRHHLGSVDLDRPQLWIGRMQKSMGKGNGSPSSSSWSIGKVTIRSGDIILDNLSATIPGIPIHLGGKVPFVLKNILTGSGASSGQLNQVQTAMVEHIRINSPLDALSPVLEFQSIELTFTWEELLNSKLRKLTIEGPKIYLGPDLFWFTDQFKKTQPSNSNEKSWEIQSVEVRAGQLAISAFGQSGVTLPFYFMSSAENAQVNRLAELPLKTKIIIPNQDRNYPAYKVTLKGMNGHIDFALPLSAQRPQNVVPTVNFDEVSWDGIAAKKAWASLTFDRTGIYGRMGGESYGGYLNGNFSVLFAQGYPWQGGFFISKVDAKPPIDQVASKYVSLTGHLDGRLQVDGKSTEIVRSIGDLKLLDVGQFQIKSVDEVIKKIPANWNFIKKDFARSFLNSFRKYDYTVGELKMDYHIPDSHLALILKGDQGERIFNVKWHQEPAKPIEVQMSQMKSDDSTSLTP